jgi:hypothetical protein
VVTTSLSLFSDPLSRRHGAVHLKSGHFARVAAMRQMNNASSSIMPIPITLDGDDLDAGNRVELDWLAGKVVALGPRRWSTRSSSPTGWGGYGSASSKPLTHRWHTAARINQMLRRIRTARPAIMQRPGVGG